jgi:hypothetical protein
MALTGFPNSRFAAPPYATPESKAAFLAEFSAEKPELVLDLHERGDNQFNVPIAAFPELSMILANEYRSWSDPRLPWVRFLVRSDTPLASRLGPLGLCPSSTKGGYSQALLHLAEIGQSVRVDKAFRERFLSEWPLWEISLRASFSEEWRLTACENGKPGVSGNSWAEQGPMWWASLALVELQPVVVPRAARDF